jgi:hypothetical protein
MILTAPGWEVVVRSKLRPLAALLLPIVLSVGCGGNGGQNPGAWSRKPSVELHGDVFIVTRGGENVKLGLVVVRAFPESTALAHLANRRVEIARGPERVDSLVAQVRRETEQARVEVSRTEKYHENLAAKMRGRPFTPKEQSGLDAAWNNYLAALRRVENEDLEVRKARGRIAYFGSAAFYLEDLPAPTEEAKTDADGKFAIMLPANERYALAATASRLVIDRTEHYYWFVWVTCKPAGENRIFLSNDNLLTVPSSESLVLAHEY